MQDEVSEKLIALCISGGKISARILKDAMEKALVDMERNNRQERYNAPAKQKEKKQTVSSGKQSLKKLAENGAQLSNIEVTDGNIKSFEKCARKYHVLYSLKRISRYRRPGILYSSGQRMWIPSLPPSRSIQAGR